MKVSRNTLVIALSVALALALFLFAGKSFSRPEPVCNGKTLSAWTQQWRANRYSSSGVRSPQTQEEAELAIRALGTNAIPFLLEAMRSKDSALKGRLRRFVPEQWHAMLQLQDQSYRRIIGGDGFTVLGPLAESALVELVKLAQDSDKDTSRNAVWALGSLGPAAEPAIPFLLQCLTNSDSHTRQGAAATLGLIHQRPETVIPALIQYLKFTRTQRGNSEAIWCMQSISYFGTNAHPAVPLLLDFLEEPDWEKRLFVTNCLRKIDPKAAERLSAGARP